MMMAMGGGHGRGCAGSLTALCPSYTGGQAVSLLLEKASGPLIFTWHKTYPGAPERELECLQESPLVLAAAGGHLEAVRLLLARGFVWEWSRPQRPDEWRLIQAQRYDR